MLVSNGVVTRNIEPEQLCEYIVKGYKEVEAEPVKKPRAKKTKD